MKNNKALLRKSSCIVCHIAILTRTNWFFATALAKQWDATLPYIEQHRLEKDTHSKTIQKAVESFRITDEQKALLKTLRVK